MSINISRRSFLQGSLAGAAGLLCATILPESVAFAEDEKTWRSAPEDITDSEIPEVCEADVIVVGAGPAGISAARSALESGASVIVIEMQNEATYDVFPSEVGNINSKFAMEKGAPEYDPMTLQHDLIRRNANRINQTLAHEFAFNSGSAIDWLLEDLDEEKKNAIEITFVNPPKYYKGEAYGYKSFIGTLFFRKENGVTLIDVIRKNIEKINAMGGRIDFSTSAYKLTKEGDRVSGVIATRDGKYYQYKAKKNVILAAGDFGGNHDMVIDLVPEIKNLLQDEADRFLCFGRNGSGIQLGIWAGGRVDPAPLASLMGGSTKPGVAGPFGDTCFLYLNKDGKRFCAEGLAHAVQTIRQPKGDIYVVWDSKWPEQLEYQAYDHACIDLHYQNDKSLNSLKTEMAAIELGNPEGGLVHDTFKVIPETYPIYAANSLEELADIMGISGEAKENFLASVERYNGFCHDGYDADFGKEQDMLFSVEDGPFYGYKSSRNNGFALSMCTGLFVNDKLQVLDTEGNPIPGLMAVGNNAGGSFALNYATPMSGCCCGTAVTLGRYSGIVAAEV